MTDIRTSISPVATLVADLSTRTGGETRRTREVKRETINAGEGVKRDLETEITVASREEATEGKAIENMIETGLRRGIGVRTPFGWIVTDDRIGDLDALIERARKRAEEFHERAKHVRVYVGVAKATFDLAQPEVVAVIGNQIETRLRAIRAMLHGGVIARADSGEGEASIESSMIEIEQIPALLVGQARHSARLAIEEIKALSAQVKRDAKDRRVSRAEAAKGIVSPMLDATIALVDPNGAPDLISDPLAPAPADASDAELDGLAGLL